MPGGAAAARLAAALAVAVLPRAALGVRVASVTPLAKVITLLESIETEIQADGRNEAASYETFSCFCRDKTATLAGSITTGKDSITGLSATMEEKTSEKEGKEAELGERRARQESLAADLANATARCAREAAEYQASNADLTKAIASLQDATQAIQSSSSGSRGGAPSPSPSPASLVAVTQAVKRSLALAEAMKLISDGPKWSASALLQQGVDPQDPSYSFHSQPILDILQRLEADFRQRKSEADSEWTKARRSCDDTKGDLSGQMTSNSDAMSTLTSDVDGLTSLLATTRGDLVQAESSLRDDQLYMTDLTALCEKRAGDWDQRAQLRANELEAIANALNLLRANVTAAEPVNRRALVQLGGHRREATSPSSLSAARGSAEGGGFSFLQGGLEKKQRAGSAGLLKLGGRATQASLHQRQLLHRALGLLQEEGSSLGSTVLASLSSRAADDPFLKVKSLIQRLIERLLKEATSEASKKGFCDADLSKATQDRTFRYKEAMKLNAQLRSLEAKRLQLEMEIGDLTESKQALQIALENATASRATEKESNLADVRTAKDGLQAVTEAILILKTFYKQAAKATVLLEKASPVEEDNPGAGFDGAYRGKQQASKGIIGLLEVIKSDFERTERMTTKAEEEAAAAFVEFDRSSRADISGKETKVTLDAEDLSTTNSTIQTKLGDMRSSMDLVDAAIREIEVLKPMCIDTGMSYAERVAKREQEVEALRRAFCILDEEGVEERLCSQWGQ